MKNTENIKTAWDLSLFYKDDKDPQIEADLKAAEAVFDDFAKKYSGNNEYLQSEELLVRALEDYEKLNETLIFKPLAYFRYRKDINSKDVVAETQSNVFSERNKKNFNKIPFFPVALSKIPKEKQSQYLKSEKLAAYRYFLKYEFEKSRYMLTESEEKILNLMHLPAHILWVQGNDKLTSNQKIPWKRKQLSLAEALSTIATLPAKERHLLADIVYGRLREISGFAESELNALVITKKIEDELRGYQKPYSATVLDYHNELTTVENLIATTTRYFPVAHRFYKLKAKMLGFKKLSYSDRNAQIGKAKKKIPFHESVKTVRQAFRKFDPEYSVAFDGFLKKGQVDVFPKVGKRGGAYCSTYPNTPTFIFLNHLADFNSARVLAHEMGHAFHSKYSYENQRPLYRDYAITTAEVASTFFENFAFDEMFSLLSVKDQMVALHDKITSSINTIFRQIACFNFELELHNTIRAKGTLPKEEIAKLMAKHMSSYLGPVFTIKELDGYCFVDWLHLRRFFYVYSYAFGELISSALYEMYKKDSSVKEKIKKFLSAGGSDSPENIFKSIGIDVRRPEFFEEGLKKIEEDVDKLEELLKKK